MIKEIEDAFVQALSQLVSQGKVRAVQTYGGQLSEEEVERISLALPVVFVVWSGFDVALDNRTDAIEARVSVIACARSLRGEAAARRGAPESVGVYEILDLSRSLLHRKPVVEGWSLVFLEREGPLAYTHEGGFAIYEQVYLLKSRL